MYECEDVEAWIVTLTLMQPRLVCAYGEILNPLDRPRLSRSPLCVRERHRLYRLRPLHARRL